MDNKKTVIQIRISESDKLELKKKASELKMNVSQYIIFKCLVEK